jgi:hypothetical protein
VSAGPDSGCIVSKSIPHEALRYLRPDKLTFAETLVVHRGVGPMLGVSSSPTDQARLVQPPAHPFTLIPLSRCLALTLTLALALSRYRSLSLAASRPPSMCTLSLCLSLWQAGLYGANGAPCTPCRAGTYKSSVGQGPCDKCPGGTFQAGTGGTGAEVCSPCPPTKISLPGSSECSVNSLDVSVLLSHFLPSSLPPSFSLSRSAYNLNPTP